MIPQTIYPQPGYGQIAYPQPNTSWATQQPPMPTQIPQQTAPAMFGKVITNPNEISPQDIPTDGNSCYFPMADKSCIYVKSWNPDCTMSTVRYVPETAVSTSAQASEQSIPPAEPVTAPEPSINDILIEHLERIEKAIKDSARRQTYGGKKNGPTETGSD